MSSDIIKIPQFDIYEQYIELLLHFNEPHLSPTFSDSSKNDFAISDELTNAICTEDVNLFWDTSLYLGGDSYLEIADSSALQLGTSDFTIECFIYKTTTSDSVFVSKGATDSNNSGLFFGTASTNLAVNIGANYHVFDSTVSLVTWHHIALVRKGTEIKVYLDGVEDSYTLSSSADVSMVGSPLRIGRISANSAHYYLGYMSDLAITKGVARYHGNFTVPTEPYNVRKPSIPLEDLTVESSLPAFIELFKIDLSSINGQTDIYYFTPMVNTANTGSGGIVWGGDTYLPFPISIENVSFSLEDAPARPKLNVANINKIFGMLSFTVQDIIGATVTYIRTFENYIGGSGTLSAPPLKYTISRKLSHNMTGLSFELRSPLDKERVMLPKRQMLKKDFPGLGLNKVYQ